MALLNRLDEEKTIYKFGDPNKKINIFKEDLNRFIKMGKELFDLFSKYYDGMV